MSSALTKNHTPPSQIAGLVDVHVSNNTRNIIISSEDPGVSAKSGTNGYGKPRGHMMFMHNADVVLQYIETENTGRTDKTIELDDWSVPEDEAAREGPYPTGAGRNPRGRYSIHFHRSIQFDKSNPNYTATPPAATVEGCVVNNDPGWGFVSHSSHVNFIRNVAYDVKGSAFCTEAGDELGSFQENIAIRTVNPTLPMDLGRPSEGVSTEFGRTEALADAREQNSDFAWQGDGFWFHSAAVTIEGNVVSGSSGHAYVYWTEGLYEPNLGRPNLEEHIDMFMPSSLNPTLNSALKAHKAANSNWKYDVWYLFPRPFRNNIAYSMARGVHGYYVMTEFHENGNTGDAEYNLTPDIYRNTMNLVIENTTLWSMKRVGIGFNHSTQVTLKNNKVYGHGTSTSNAPWNVTGLPSWQQAVLEVEPAVLGMDLDHYHNTRTWLIENNTIEGFNGQAQALNLPINANTTVNGGTFNNSGIDIKIREVNWLKSWWERPDVITNTSDNGFNPLPTGTWKTTPWRTIRIEGNIQFNNSNQNIVLDPQFLLNNAAQDAFAIWHADGIGTGIKQSVYFMLPDEIILNFGPFNNSKVYYDEQAASHKPVPNSNFLTPLTYSNDDIFPERRTPVSLPRTEPGTSGNQSFADATNQQLWDSFGMSFGGGITPSGTQSHPILNGGTATNVGASNQAPTVSITSPANNADFSEGSNVVINATAADAD
ncbi:Ig-like domain-containing protein, partial [Moorena producens]|uniref:Ig-like domain-containing protein n=1 Tax=Moorena producens TaxID=1155739 RepID=UPI001E54A78E